MTTQMICDFPDCGRAAVWKVELSDISPGPWSLGGQSSFTITGNPPPRHSMDVCAKHLPRVTFDLNEIAAFDREKAGVAGEGCNHSVPDRTRIPDSDAVWNAVNEVWVCGGCGTTLSRPATPSRQPSEPRIPAA